MTELEHSPKRNPWPLVAGGLAVVLVGAGVAAYLMWPKPTPATAATMAATTAATSAPAPTATATRHGGTIAAAQQACAAMKAENERAQKPDPAEARRIGTVAAGAGDDQVRLYGEQLVVAADIATAAVGNKDEAAKALDLLSAEIQLRTACIKGHYERVP